MITITVIFCLQNLVYFQKLINGIILIRLPYSGPIPSVDFKYWWLVFRFTYIVCTSSRKCFIGSYANGFITCWLRKIKRITFSLSFYLHVAVYLWICTSWTNFRYIGSLGLTEKETTFSIRAIPEVKNSGISLHRTNLC